MAKKLTLDEVIPRFRKKHGDKYNYDFFEYVGAKIKSLILCDCGNLFAQHSSAHLTGYGCSFCGIKKRAKSKSRNREEVILGFHEKHGDKYNYDFFEYTGAKIKSLILCDCGNLFAQHSNAHLEGRGCSFCGIKKSAFSKTHPQKEVVEQFQKTHGDKYNYDFFNYKGMEVKEWILCDCGNLFTQLPTNHLNGSGCSACAIYGFNPSKPAILYYLRDTTTNLYKIGITNRTVKERFGPKMKEIRIIKTWSFENGQDAQDQERNYHKQFSNQRTNNDNFRKVGGFTEFFEGDVLNLDIN